MYTNSQNIGQFGSERQRDALARAEQQRRAQRLRRSTRDTEHPGRHQSRMKAWLHAVATRQRP
jgi:hypothetical protein